jgi:multidrug resistance efflux pump
VQDIDVTDNQHVTAGQVLYRPRHLSAKVRTFIDLLAAQFREVNWCDPVLHRFGAALFHAAAL